MKKILMLPALAIMGMVGIAGAAPCGAYCAWNAATCANPIDSDYGTKADCPTQIAACEKDSAPGATFATSEECTAAWNALSILGYCLWNGTDCGPITDATKQGDCTGNPLHTYFPGATTCGPGGGTSTPGGGYSAPGGGYSSPYSPILQHNGMAKVTGLTLAPHSLGMQISTQKDAKLSIFDARGNMVYKSDVVAGINVVNLQDQKQGVYFAVVASGSLKQSLRVIVK